MAAVEEQITVEIDLEAPNSSPNSNEINAEFIKKSYSKHGSNLEKTIRNIDNLERIKAAVIDVKQKKAIDEIIQEFNDGESER